MYGAEITLEQEKVLLKGMALDYRERYSSVRELREAFLGKDEQESPEAEKKKGQAFRKFVPLLLGTVIVGVAGTGILWAGRTEPKVQYAGNFYRGSREAQELLTLTRTKRQPLLKHRRMEQTVFFICQRKQPEHTDFPVTAFGFSEQERNWMLI